jgi:BlaI family transcriptional regulator, penicillinase repressor
MNDLPRISDAEWEVMRVVWEKHPISAHAVARRLNGRRDWSARTVKTLLSRLVRKEALGFDLDGKRYLYRPLVSMDDCVREASRSFLERTFGGAVRPALLHFVRESDLSPEEIAELERLLEDQKDGAP